MRLAVLLALIACGCRAGTSAADAACDPMRCPTFDDLSMSSEPQDLSSPDAAPDGAAAVKSCGDDGDPCSADTDCCRRSCAHATHTCNGATGAGLGDTCYFAGPTVLGWNRVDCDLYMKCWNDFIQGSAPGVCVPQGASCNGSCTTDADCCVGSCTTGQCLCAVAPGSPCTSASDCCGAGIRDAADCQGGLCCRYAQTRCRQDSDCCSGQCLGGSCAGVPAGGACDYDIECTSQRCQGTACRCTDAAFTGQLAVECVSDADCCFGICDPATRQCTGAALGAMCNVDEDCGSRYCMGGICTCIPDGQRLDGVRACCGGANNGTICMTAPGNACTAGSLCDKGTTCTNGKCCGCQSGQDCGTDVCDANVSCGTCAAGFGCWGNPSICVCGVPCRGPCGTDGCGESCGTCAPGATCIQNRDGTSSCQAPMCVPVVPCGTLKCGYNSCMQDCGTCPAGEKCAQGQCVANGTPCTGSCAGKVCGDDGCGHSCGTCGGLNCINGQCTSSTGGSCPDDSGCIVSYSSSICGDFISVQNICSYQVTCKYTLDNGASGCDFPEPGAHDCFIYDPSHATGRIYCTRSGNTTCEAAIGCQ